MSYISFMTWSRAHQYTHKISPTHLSQLSSILVSIHSSLSSFQQPLIYLIPFPPLPPHSHILCSGNPNSTKQHSDLADTILNLPGTVGPPVEPQTFQSFQALLTPCLKHISETKSPQLNYKALGGLKQH